MEFISETQAKEARERAAIRRSVVNLEARAMALLASSDPKDWVEADRVSRQIDDELSRQWRLTDNYRQTIAMLKSGTRLQIFP
jgi:hypothetical protein